MMTSRAAVVAAAATLRSSSCCHGGGKGLRMRHGAPSRRRRITWRRRHSTPLPLLHGWIAARPCVVSAGSALPRSRAAPPGGTPCRSVGSASGSPPSPPVRAHRSIRWDPRLRPNSHPRRRWMHPPLDSFSLSLALCFDRRGQRLFITLCFDRRGQREKGGEG